MWKSDPIKANVRHYRMLAYKISACEVCIIWRKPTEALKKPLPIAESRTGKPAMVTLIKTLFQSPWHDLVDEHLYTQPFTMWNRLRFHPFLQVTQTFQRRKRAANKQDFEIKLNLTYQAKSPPPPPHTHTHTNQGILHRWSKFGGASWNGSLSYCASKLKMG